MRARTIKNYVLFEISMKGLTLLLLSPLLNACIQAYLNSRGSQVFYNFDLFKAFFSLPGLLLCLLTALCSLAAVFFEISVTVLLIADFVRGSPRPLRAVLLDGAERLKCLLHPSTLPAAAYFMALLPFVHLGYRNSLIPSLDVPPFILGELQLTSAGTALIAALYAAAQAAFFLLTFAPLYMILKKEPFSRACRNSARLLRKMGPGRFFALAGLYLFYFLLDYFLRLGLGSRLLGIDDFNFYMLRQLVYLNGYRESFVLTIGFAVIASALSVVFIGLLLSLFLREESAVGPKIEPSLYTKGFVRAERAVSCGLRSLRAFAERHRILRLLCLIALALGLMDYFNPAALIHKPYAIGHRGDIYEAENSLPGILSADRYGADYAEIDIQLSKDGIPVVVHDENLGRQAGLDADVPDLTAEELGNVVTSTFRGSAKIPTLREAVETAKSSPGGIGLLIELKPRKGQAREMADKVFSVVEEAGFADRAIYMSMDEEAVSYMQSVRPEYWIGYCIFGAVGSLDISRDADFLAVEESQVNSRFLSVAREVDLPIYVWTMSDTEKMRRYLSMGVSGIIGNCVEDIAPIVRAYREAVPDYAYYYTAEGYPKRAPDGSYANGEAGKID